MRAPDQAHSKSAVVDGEASRLLTRVVVAIVATGALLLVWRPAIVHAQDSAAVTAQPPAQPPAGAKAPDAESPKGATATHVVKAGETLWSIAARYYGDGHQWLALARTNRIPTTGARGLDVGMKLTVPAQPTVRGADAAARAAAPADSTVPRVALAKAGEGTLPAPRKSGSLAAQTAAKGNAGAAARRTAPAAAKAPAEPAPAVDTGRADLTPQRGTLIGNRGGSRIGLVDQGDQIASRKPNEVETVFLRDLPDAAEAERRTRAALRPNTPAPRRAELESAPFMISASQLAASGQVDQRLGSSTTFLADYPQRAIKTDQVTLQAPAGAAYKVGDRLVAFTTVPSAKGKGASLIAVPTGVLVVVKTEAGKPALAELTRQSGRVEQGQRVVPAPSAAGEWVQAVALATPDVATTVRWLDASELLPTLQSFLLLGAGEAQGLKAGDEVALYRRPAGAATESLVATVRVVRADRETSTAIVTRQYSSDIGVGMTARRYAKAP